MVAGDLGALIAAALGAYLLLIFGLAWWAHRRIERVEDFLVAGRRLSLPLASATLLATWFGAGTILTSADEVRAEGLRAAALEPLGAGVCLLLAGGFMAAPLWRMRLLTLADFYRIRFGPRAELLAAVMMVPGYFGWTAAQFLALAGILELFLGLDSTWGVVLVAAVGTAYTATGGMWSVTLTDALQVGLLLVGLVVLGVTVVLRVGVIPVAEQTPPGMLVVVPTASVEAFVSWLGVFAVAALGNLPGQDLMQRVFSSRSAGVARRACFLAGGAYLMFGCIPVYLALASRVLLPEQAETAILPALASAFLSPPLAVTFAVVLASAVLSTIDSAMLAPSALLANNVLPRFVGERIGPLALNRAAVLLTATASLSMAFVGEDAYSLLEESYAIGLVGLLVPLAMGLYRKPRGERAAVVCIAVGSGLWLVHLALGWQTFAEPWLSRTPLPVALMCALVGFGSYLIVDGTEDVTVSGR